MLNLNFNTQTLLICNKSGLVVVGGMLGATMLLGHEWVNSTEAMIIVGVKRQFSNFVLAISKQTRFVAFNKG